MAQFFNTAVSSLVINAALPELVKGVPILDGTVFSGTYRDFDQAWYQAIGGPLMVTMLVNTIGPVGGNLFAEWFGSVNRFVGRATAWTQHSLDEAYLGPEFDIATRYGEVLMCVMVTMMYGSGMPLLYAFACFFCVTIAYCDKRHLLRVCRRPPRYGTSLAYFALQVVPYAGLVHLLVGMWMHTHFVTPRVGYATGKGVSLPLQIPHPVEARLRATVYAYVPVIVTAANVTKAHRGAKSNPGYTRGLTRLTLYFLHPGPDTNSALLGDDAYVSALRESTRNAFANALATGASLGDILAIARNASSREAASRGIGYAPIPDEINRRILQANGFPFFLCALFFVAGSVAYKVLTTFWNTFKACAPCFTTLPCLRKDLTFEGVPAFEHAFMTDKLVGAHTYEMRELPKYKDFFFESKTPGATPQKKRQVDERSFRGENDERRGYASDSSDSSDSDTMGNIGAALRAVGAGGAGGRDSSIGTGLGGNLGLRAAYGQTGNGSLPPSKPPPAAARRPASQINQSGTKAAGVANWGSPGSRDTRAPRFAPPPRVKTR